MLYHFFFFFLLTLFFTTLFFFFCTALLHQKVANLLLRKGRMPVGQIATMTTLKPRQVRESLFVMIQHNIAVYAESQERNRIVVYYEIYRPELLHRALLPKALYFAQKWFGSDGGWVAHTISKHGKMTIGDCIKDTFDSIPSGILLAGKSLKYRKGDRHNRNQKKRTAITDACTGKTICVLSLSLTQIPLSFPLSPSPPK